MEIVADRLDWTQFDEQKWRDFLDTETGKRVIPKLLESVPGLLPGGDTNAIMIRSGEHRGLQLAVSKLIEMSHSDPESKPDVISEGYPPLEDDAKWNDGFKISEVPEPRKIDDIV